MQCETSLHVSSRRFTNIVPNPQYSRPRGHGTCGGEREFESFLSAQPKDLKAYALVWGVGGKQVRGEERSEDHMQAPLSS